MTNLPPNLSTQIKKISQFISVAGDDVQLGMNIKAMDVLLNLMELPAAYLELNRKQTTIDAQAAEITHLRDACQSAWDVLKDTPNAEVLSKLYAALAESE